jgi:hypothetical protein
MLRLISSKAGVSQVVIKYARFWLMLSVRILARLAENDKGYFMGCATGGTCCGQDRKSYEESTYQASLHKHGSDLVKLFDRVDPGKSPFKNPAKKN